MTSWPPAAPDPAAFTLRSPGRLAAIRTIVAVWPASQSLVPPLEAKACNALYDTGATGSVISLEVAADLGLVSAGRSPAHTANGSHECDTHMVSIALPNRVIFQVVRVAAMDLPPGVDMLVGMDILASGDLAITNHDGKTIFTFRYPSSHEIDFVQELEWAKAPMGGPCPCGSGKKHKHCHAR